MTQNSDNNFEDNSSGADSAQTSNGSTSGDQDNVIKMEGEAQGSNGTPASDLAAEWRSKAAYLTAEIDNMRKRFAREKQDVLKFANEEMIKKFLPVLDCLELALKAAKDSESKLDPSIRDNPMLQNLIKGLDMTIKVFDQTLESSGCVPVKSVGETFDPTQHEALGQSQDLSLGENMVSGVMQRGFNLSGRVIRTAKVLVNKINN